MRTTNLIYIIYRWIHFRYSRGNLFKDANVLSRKKIILEIIKRDALTVQPRFSAAFFRLGKIPNDASHRRYCSAKISFP